jgi:hypothetical protein
VWAIARRLTSIPPEVPAKATTIGASVGALRRGISLLAPLSSSAKADDPVRRGHA